jgi:DNA-binding response OmpR family regulator
LHDVSKLFDERSSPDLKLLSQTLETNMPRQVLIVEDDPDIAESLRYNLEREGLEARIAETGEKGLAAALEPHNVPVLVILDLMLPGMSGTELCRRLRREPQMKKVPIIMLTARTSEADRINGLDLGADDYITKPFSVRELMARVRAVLRRADEGATKRYEDNRLAVDFENMRVTCAGETLKLTRKEFSLLTVLVRSSGRVATRQRLLDDVWGHQYYGDQRTLDVHIRRLRQKLGTCGDSIETVVGTGYRFVGSSGSKEKTEAAELE